MYNMEAADYIKHYGTPRHSGRYPWGSGGEVSVTRSKSFLDYVKDLEKQGLSQKEIADGYGISIKELRAARSIASNTYKNHQISQAQRLVMERGWSKTAAAERMGINESTVRSLLKQAEKDQSNTRQAITNMLKDNVDTKGYIDVGIGTEIHLGISRTKLDTSIEELKIKGYKLFNIQEDQITGQNKTTLKILAPPGTTYKDIVSNKDKIKFITDSSSDGGRTFNSFKPPLSIDSKRVLVKYEDDGGAENDGVIFVRPGVSDLSLGSKAYGQVRVMIDGTHYLKGMAVFKDDLPKGIDLVYNTNKTRTANKKDAMKPISDDPTLPFKALVRQRLDEKGNPISALNTVGSKEGSGEEGSWDTWSKSLSTQVLSKQTPKLIKQQLDMTYENRKAQFDSISKLTNPVVKQKMLLSFADDVDSAAVHLKTAQLPRQSTKVILPVNSLKDNEVYAPSYRAGERVVLIRYPHGGIFEIPELTVTHKNKEAQTLLGKNPRDAIAINHKVASKLSGADFDGDTVLVIPNNNRNIKTAPSLEGLKNFDPIRAYKNPEGVKYTGNRQVMMGDVTNLITDMTIKGASNDELARAVRHSMVVIDAEKHNLNYKQSAIDNNIKNLKQKYQNTTESGRPAGASTLISLAGKEKRVPEIRERAASRGGPIDPKTGKKIYEETGAITNVYNKKTGQWEPGPKLSKVNLLAMTDDARKLSSGTEVENLYASHSNKLKALANEARKEALKTPQAVYSPSAAKTYEPEVKRLTAALNVAIKNAPLERQAQLIANTIWRAKKEAAGGEIGREEAKKIKQAALNEARIRTGAKKQKIDISEREWQAIQAGAVRSKKLKDILDNTDLDKVKEYAMPKPKLLMTATKTTRAKAMLNSGYTEAEVADALGVSVSTLRTVI